jgi:DNA-binding NtrC family response regulator
MKKLRVLFCDDSSGVLKGFERNVARPLDTVAECVTAPSVESVERRVAAGEAFDMVVTDLNFEKVGGGPKDGIEILTIAKEHWPDCEVVLMTAYEGSLDVRDGMRLRSLGVNDAALLQKTDAEDPGLTWIRLRERIQGIAALRAAEVPRVADLRREVAHLRGIVEGDAVEWVASRTIRQARQAIESDERLCFRGMVGRSYPMQDLASRIKRAARLPSDVLILGPTGVGKDLVARAIHDLSARSEKPYVKVDLATLSGNLVESELFGHEKGAFTGADQRKDGLFAAAGGGTFFLDEIGNVPLEIQAKLLRVLEERKYRPLGSARDVEIDVRVIAATNAALEHEVEEGRFREDLFERLNVVRLVLPSLAQRQGDVPLQVAWFLAEFATKFGFTRLERIDEAALRRFQDAEWPRNVRQLRHAVERLFAEIDPDAVTIDEAAVAKVLDAPARPNGDARTGDLFRDIAAEKLSLSLAELKKLHGEIATREIIRRTMLHCGGMPDDQDCARLFGGMTANAWRQFAFQLGLTWRAVKEGRA